MALQNISEEHENHTQKSKNRHSKVDNLKIDILKVDNLKIDILKVDNLKIDILKVDNVKTETF